LSLLAGHLWKTSHLETAKTTPSLTKNLVEGLYEWISLSLTCLQEHRQALEMLILIAMTQHLGYFQQFIHGAKVNQGQTTNGGGTVGMKCHDSSKRPENLAMKRGRNVNTRAMEYSPERTSPILVGAMNLPRSPWWCW
jgi:hypothetical protein